MGIQFGIFSPEEIVKRSVVEVLNHGTYDGGEPKMNGLFDPRMGVLDNGKTCRSCGQTNHNCPGHFGHYRLARPVYFIQFFQNILNVLRCVCVRCSKLLIDKQRHASLATRRGESRWREVLTLCSNIRRCGQETEDGCGTVQPSRYVRDGIANILAEWDDLQGEEDTAGKATTTKTRQKLEVEFVLRLFRQILDEDVDFMGLSRNWCRPEWMICTVLPIPPPQVRPSVVQDNNQRSEDDLTHKLFEIIRFNKKLQDYIDKNDSRYMIDEYTNILQYHIATLVDNKIPGVAPSAQRGGRPLKSIQQRIGSKEGRVRYNIMGKRVEQSARSVITGDPNISISEVGVPMKIAMNLTKPEHVTTIKGQRDRLYKFIQNGADVYPGAKSIVRKDGRMISLKHVKNLKEIVLYPGDIVNRHLMDGDVILFNRQPTLHRMSMMAHRVRVLPFNTFRLNVTVTRPYNADFDGDEMNAHIPQSYEATAELQEIAAVPQQIVRPRDAMPLIAVVQDALAGAYLATQPDNLFTRREFMNLMMKNSKFQDLPQPREGKRYTGQQIVGSLLAPINVNMKNSSFEADERPLNIVKIVEGDFQQGVLDKGIFNKSGKGIVHTTYNDYGPADTVALLDGLQNVMESYLIMKGFSVGISDLIADEATREEMHTIIQDSKKELDQMLLQVHMDLFTNNSGKTNQEELEARALAILSKALNGAGKKGVDNLPNENRLMTMIRSGSKGDANNVSQMMACLGQVALDGKRIPYGFTDRTLPHYKLYDDGAEARGFVESSFLRGLTPQEMFFHAMSGREGLIDTAVKTAETGYTQRKLIKAMEELTTQHDGTVRDATGNILQFYYGEDGSSNTKIEEISIPLDKLAEDQIRNTFGLVGMDMTGIFAEGTERGDDREALDDYVRQILKDRQMLVEGIHQSIHNRKLFVPLNLERILMNIRIKFNLNPNAPTNLTPSYVLSTIETIAQRTQPYNRLWTAALRYWLAPHSIIAGQRFTKEAFDTLVETIVVKNWKSWALPGELVGIVAAQSIGEPATQMTLNTFHQAGVASKRAMTQGVPRLNELLKVTKNPKTTSLTIQLQKEFRNDKDRVREVMQDLELTLLRDIVLKSAIYYDPRDQDTILEEDKELITFFETFELREGGEGGQGGAQKEKGEDASPFSRWLIRLEFDREKMFNKSITMDDVNFVIQDTLGFTETGLNVIYSDYNSKKLIMRIRIQPNESVYGDDLASIKKFQNKLLNNTIIRGVPGIRAVMWRKDKNSVELKDGKYQAVDQYILDTDGANFLAVMNHPAVDGRTLYSTNVYDIYEQLGIEATRNILYKEISSLFGEADINYRHLGLLVDTMTRNGRLMSVDRYGVNKADSGPIAKACFEETEKIFLKAAQFGEMDPITGVSANIMMGQTIRAGTAFTQILLDEAALPRLLEGLPPVEVEEEEEEAPTQEMINSELYGADHDLCTQTQLSMNMTLPVATSAVEEDEIEIMEV